MKRPLIITIWAAFLTVATLLGLASAAWLYFSGEHRSHGLYEGVYAYYNPISHVLGLVMIHGLWTMRKWAFVYYVASQIVAAAIFWTTHPSWSAEMPSMGWSGLVVAALFAATTLPYWRRMSWRPLPLKDVAPEAIQAPSSKT